MEANFYENKNQFELEKQLIIISVPTISKLLSYGKEGADALLLYNFYYYTAKRQDTNQPKATPRFCMQALGWGEKRFYRADRILREENLIKKEKVFDKKGRIIGWYVRINYIWTTKKVKETNPEPLNGQPEPLNSTTVKNTGSGQKSINALSVNNINALSVNNKEEQYSKIFCQEQVPDRSSSPPLNSEYKQFEKEIVEEWNKLSQKYPVIPCVRVIGSDRRRHLKQRFANKEFVKHYKEALAKIPEYKFLLGENPRRWVANFDWFIRNDSNWAKILEGKYKEVLTEADKRRRAKEIMRRVFGNG